MSLLIDLLIGVLAYYLAQLVLHAVGLSDPWALIIAIIVGIVVFLQRPSGRIGV